ncbi:putative Flavin-containing monooxygenase [Citricoccus sp. K5]|nr:putative Flavin-containing monooxygenase [Citricoccus sp. K5]
MGAGPAGLAITKHLLGRHCNVTVYEKGAHVGGLWVYGNDSGAGVAYRSLRINSEAKDTGYRDFPIPTDASIFPTHYKMREYFDAYADEFKLRPHIRFNSEVTKVYPLGERCWRVALADGSEFDYDRVVIANGHQSIPSDPPFAGDFTGTYLHSRDYRTPEPFAGKNVLVVGTGNSGLDIAADVCVSARRTVLAARSPVLIMPRMLFGVPLSRFLAKVERPWLPWPLARRLREMVTYIVHGRMERWGFETPKGRTHPASHPTVMAHIAWNRIAVRPGAFGARGITVRFDDGSEEDFDAVIAATGYAYDIPFLDDEVTPISDGRIDLYRRIVTPEWPGLYFIGLFDVSGGANIRMMDIQSRWLGALIAGDIELPSIDAMKESITEEHARMAKLYPSTKRYGLELDPREYGLTIREDLARAKATATSAAAPPELAKAAR